MVQEKNERGSKKISEITAARHQSLRDELLAAAERHIEAHGLETLRARDLAVTAGCSLGAIYNVFADLDELILAVNANTLRAIDATMGAIKAPTPQAQFLALADAYLTYVVQNRPRWDALFNHRMPPDEVAPDWFLTIQNAAFSHIEAPLGALRPDLDDAARHTLGRSIFAAVHGMVALGVDKRLAPIELAALRGQVALVVGAIGRGLEEESSFL